MQTPIVGGSIIPERGVPGIRHNLHLGVSYGGLVLLGGGRLDNRIISAMRDQYRLAELR